MLHRAFGTLNPAMVHIRTNPRAFELHLLVSPKALKKKDNVRW